MKRNVYLILITVITILCIIAGTGYHLVRFGLSVAEGLPSFSEFIETISDWDDDDGDDSDDSDNGISTSIFALPPRLKIAAPLCETAFPPAVVPSRPVP